MSKTFEQLNEDVIYWAIDRGIFSKSDPKSQLLKTVSEIGELADATNEDDLKKIIDGVGDVLVTLIIYCNMKNINAVSSLESAYEIINKRTGNMINGVFVKDK